MIFKFVALGSTNHILMEHMSSVGNTVGGLDICISKSMVIKIGNFDASLVPFR